MIRKLMKCILRNKDQEEMNSFGKAVEAMSQSTQDLMMFSHNLTLLNAKLIPIMEKERKSKEFESLISSK